MGFRRLDTADKFIADATKYKAWKALSTSGRQTEYDKLNVKKFTYNKQIIYVPPFQLSDRKVFVQTKGPATNQTTPCPTLLTLLAGYFETVAPAPATNSVIQPSLFPVSKLAKMVAKHRATPATAKSDSRITGAKYYRHENNSVSMSFGKSASINSYGAAVAAIVAVGGYNTFAEVKGNSISFIPEG